MAKAAEVDAAVAVAAPVSLFLFSAAVLVGVVEAEATDVAAQAGAAVATVTGVGELGRGRDCCSGDASGPSRSHGRDRGGSSGGRCCGSRRCCGCARLLPLGVAVAEVGLRGG